MLGVDEGADAALLLRFGNGVQRERGLAGGFRSVDLDDTTPRQAADAERDVEAERAGRDRLDLDRLLVLAQAHDRALAESPFDLRERRIERLGLVHRRAFHEPEICLIHDVRSLWQGRDHISIRAMGMTMVMVCSLSQVLFLFLLGYSESRCLEPFLTKARGR
ncbi:hypothetical protein BOSE46_140178 [Bosea sp. 46]|nr:hypothetical protein BOSE46_140178 [Bosea sp. 46]CAD5269112.1 hypothetical protein BOSE7B_20058 [Bosea sp. 7B]VXB96389.1 hypothetical protein BOSE29B_150172 [Bosea sp. 29B]VXC41778.1 hypothetical protein BOSE125_200145 [Bosea sp. 125]VXC62443.1 hypothetical protein BOSE127_30072 [Bosea sp. 127]